MWYTNPIFFMCVSRQFAGIILFTRKELNMYSIVKTAIVRGMDSVFVGVEADVSEGLPVFEMVGFLSSEVKEAKERVQASRKENYHKFVPGRGAENGFRL